MAKKIVVLGGGESGVGAALLAQAKGYDVFLSDKSELGEAYRNQLLEHGIPFEEKQHTETRIFEADEIIKSPGIPDHIPLIKSLREKQIPVIGEIEFAARFTKARLIAITGSNGKTTTTLLTYHLLKTAGLNVGLAGNIGDSFAKQVITDSFDYYVLEISSFMLDSMVEFKADIAILTNITPDHLDRYQYDFQQYIDSKFRILQNMGPADTFIYWQESEAIAQELGKRTIIPQTLPISTHTELAEGVSITATKIIAHTATQDFEIALADLPIAGTHNALNASGAILAALSLGVSDEAIREGLRTFQNAPHRLEPVGELKGIRFINDSKATNVDSVFFALGSYAEPLILIMGGVDKGNDYTQIESLVSEKVKMLICLGTDNTKLQTFFSGKVPVILETQQIEQAVAWGYEQATAGDVVLLSPACASFDLFKNYEDRGNQFRSQVQKLIHKNS
ncbi:UDP-N-acetylmuramoyl-L-alanine--D-glutamate ligase [Siphonobacter sp.]|uniref:UDP-N-acetylmuramoyl-L-alanine--D-glutamate ligase n=1 Tax=Siphonobacter sp. TaxID=1869184 RepID=UPI003B3A3915